MSRIRWVFSQFQVLAVAAIFGIAIIVFIGLVAAGLHKVSTASNRTTCLNNLKQIGLAVHTCNDTYSKLPPVVGVFPNPAPSGTPAASGSGFGGPLFHLLPFVEQAKLYKVSSWATVTKPGTYATGTPTIYFPGNNNAYSRPVPTYFCPSDPSIQDDGTVTLTFPAVAPATKGVASVWGASSYGLNAFAFVMEPGYHQNVDPPTPNGNTSRLDESNLLPKGIPDGLSNTFMVLHRYGQCQSTAYPSGGSTWGYAPDPSFAAPFSAPAIGTPPYAMLAAVAVPAFGPGALGSASMFQAQPNPFAGVKSVCNSLLAQTPHGKNMPVCLFDASLRTISNRISPASYWHYMTPNGGERPDADIDN